MIDCCLSFMMKRNTKRPWQKSEFLIWCTLLYHHQQQPLLPSWLFSNIISLVYCCRQCVFVCVCMFLCFVCFMLFSFLSSNIDGFKEEFRLQNNVVYTVVSLICIYSTFAFCRCYKQQQTQTNNKQQHIVRSFTQCHCFLTAISP